LSSGMMSGITSPARPWFRLATQAKHKPFKSVYFEVAGDNEKVLRDSGYDEFPIMAPRWEVNGEDVSGSSCPGMLALGG
ncbi:portal protein, partial [Proteus mirabilis]|uniref:portal protein n=1 Tax=Proteus mirabilis TaxID=584 RepID=UPI002577677D